ncbi:MAG: hypothetical protein GTO02_15100 [Candidatus Dadabacteria bacterium]|nr:hypothetical protein [Candidatus Dadabacteria bacterium]
MNHETLKEMIIKKIDDYLADNVTEKEANKWALEIIKKYPFHDSDIAFALMDLMCSDEPERYRTAREDLIWRRDRLTGKKSKKRRESFRRGD